MRQLTEADLEIALEALGILRQDALEITLASLNESAEPLPAKARRALEPARAEVMAAHDWSWARRTVATAPLCGPGGVWAAPLPEPGRVTEVFGQLGPVGGWRLEGLSVTAREPFVAVRYVADVEDVSLWPALPRRALAYCLARDLAIPVTGRRIDYEMLREAYASQLQAAKLADARQGNPGRAAWGRRPHTEAVAGGWRGRMGEE